MAPSGAGLTVIGECSFCGECCHRRDLAQFMYKPDAQYCRYLTPEKRCIIKLGTAGTIPTKHVAYYKEECIPYPDPQYFTFIQLPEGCTKKFVTAIAQ